MDEREMCRERERERGRFDKDSTVWRTLADATGQLQGQRAKENVVQILSTRGHRLSRALAEEFLIARFQLRSRHDPKRAKSKGLMIQNKK